MTQRYQSLAEFYPYYLSEHRDGTCRTLHFIGSICVLALIAVAVLDQSPAWLWYIAPAGYGFAWIGHFFFEKNRPATFSYPLYSLLSDWIMFRDIIIGRVPLRGELQADR